MFLKKVIVSAVFALFLSACSYSPNNTIVNNESADLSSNDKLSKPLDLMLDVKNDPNIKYDNSHLLVKQKSETYIDLNSDVAKSLKIDNVITNTNSDWSTIVLKNNAKADELIEDFRNSGLFDVVDFDYIYESDAFESKDASDNSKSLGVEEAINLDEAYEYMSTHGGTPGGDSSVVIAVLDTGVDYEHPDLKDNIWVNSDEIPNNGIDDDNNGYVDDVIGWNCVGNNNDPMDDNGHGTHVAGIIGAENNGIGTTGVAYNCTIMPVKCGNSSNTFNNSDIAEGIRYAYMNGADIISMSIGGSSISLEVQEALEDAYTTSFLVAAAGNDSAQNQLRYSGYDVIRTYPASFSFVCGVMSCNATYNESWFTNFDTYPNNSNEYEIYAPGEAVYSTYPDNRYTSLNGTSMATPVVSAVAALIRSMHPDKEMYPTKYLFSQIANTSTNMVWPYHPISETDEYGYCVDAYAALAKASIPNVKVYDRYTFDKKEFSSSNNGDGTINSGETIRMGIDFINVGGALTNTKVTVDTFRDEEHLLFDNYITFTKDTVNYGTIGTYSNKDGGLIYDSDGITVVDLQDYFEFEISDDCPDEYSIVINVRLEGTDTNGEIRKFDLSTSISVSNRILLPQVISQDTTLTKEHSYLLLNSMRILENVTLTIEPGVDIQVYNDINSDYYAEVINSPSISVWGKVICKGAEDEYVNIHNADWYINYMWSIYTIGNGQVYFEYTNLYNAVTSFTGYNFARSNINIKNSVVTFYSTIMPDNNMCYIINGSTSEPIDTIGATFVVNSIASSTILLKSTVVFDTNYSSETIYEFSPESEKKYYWDGTKLKFRISATNNILINKNDISLNPFNLTLTVIPGETEYNGNALILTDTSSYSNTFKISLEGNGTEGEEYSIYNTLLYGIPESLYDYMVNDFFDRASNFILTNKQTDDFDISKLPPFVTDIKINNMDGDEVTTVGKESFRVFVKFNRDMDTSLDLDVTFGSVRPYADYVINGTFVDNRTWEGIFDMTKIANAGFEGGYQHFSVENARAADNHSLILADNANLFTFTIDTTTALAMSMQAISTNKGVELTWVQDDYDVVMGYNIYRSEKENGDYTKLNTTIIPKEETTFIDDNAEPGKTYYYVFTVVLTDLSESTPSGKTQCTVLDTILPTVYHTPVNQGYAGNNLLISVTASDNIGVKDAKLYYRKKGDADYKVVTMSKYNDRYTGKINANDVTLEGIEYYIEVDDGFNITQKGSALEPYYVVIKEAPEKIIKGDVNNDGAIDVADALMMKQHIEGTRLLTNDEFDRADLNDDGEISSLEVLMVLQYVNGNIATL